MSRGKAIASLAAGTARPRAERALHLAAMLCALGCTDSNKRRIEAEAATLAGGIPTRGAVSIERYGCGTCHSIPGIRGADSLVGPPLSGVAQRVYLAGVVANTPENTIRWIMSPPSIDALTAVPETGISERDARDIAAYLYTLR